MRKRVAVLPAIRRSTGVLTALTSSRGTLSGERQGRQKTERTARAWLRTGDGVAKVGKGQSPPINVACRIRGREQGGRFWGTQKGVPRVGLERPGVGCQGSHEQDRQRNNARKSKGTSRGTKNKTVSGSAARGRSLCAWQKKAVEKCGAK